MNSWEKVMKINSYYALIFFLFTIPLGANGLEVIDSFDSAITVHADGSMQVVETINYSNKGVQGLHGITRDFPTHYKDRWGNNVVVSFQVEEVLRDGYPVPYRVGSLANGKRIYIGDNDKVVPPGNYIYTIRYTTNRQLGYFDDHDELYWNVTGNGSRFPILQATARVTLPGVPAQEIKAEAYTGYQDQKGHDYTAQVASDGVSSFATKRPLEPTEGLSIVVSWPKGYVPAPTFLTKLG